MSCICLPLSKFPQWNAKHHLKCRPPARIFHSTGQPREPCIPSPENCKQPLAWVQKLPKIISRYPVARCVALNDRGDFLQNSAFFGAHKCLARVIYGAPFFTLLEWKYAKLFVNSENYSRFYSDLVDDFSFFTGCFYVLWTTHSFGPIQAHFVFRMFFILAGLLITLSCGVVSIISASAFSARTLKPSCIYLIIENICYFKLY